MASKNPALNRAVIDYARARKYHPDDAERVAKARGDLTAARIEAFIEKALADAPPLTDAQRRRLARLLTGGES